MRRSRLRGLAWVLGAGGAIGCCAGAALAVVFAAPPSFLLVYLVGVLMGVLGALVAARDPHNSIGWLMCAMSLSASLLHLPTGYAYFTLVVQDGSWPLASFAAWLGAWSWIPVVAFLPVIALRFPDGRALRYMHAVDWIVIAGVVLFAGGIALAPANTILGFTSIPGSRVVEMQRNFDDVLGSLLPEQVTAQIRGLGLVFVLSGYVASASALATRFRSAPSEQRVQLEWFAYACALVAAAFVYGGIAWTFLGQPLYIALTPLDFAALALPLSIGIAILRYRLYDIDLLINRTLVYAGLTATLGALYAAVVTFLNRLFISVSGQQKSDAAYVITAFVVAVAFGPVRDWLQRQVDRHIGRSDAAQLLEQFRSGVESVVAVLDVERVRRQLLDRAVTAFNARGAALYLASTATPVYRRGEVDGAAVVEVHLRHDGRELGTLVMGPRRGGAEYSDHDRAALQRSADSVAGAMVLAEHLGEAQGRAPWAIVPTNTAPGA